MKTYRIILNGEVHATRKSYMLAEHQFKNLCRELDLDDNNITLCDSTGEVILNSDDWFNSASDKAVQEAIEEANRIMQEKYGDNWNDGSEGVSLPISTWDDILNESSSHKWVFNRVDPVDHPLMVSPQQKIPSFNPHSEKFQNQ